MISKEAIEAAAQIAHNTFYYGVHPISSDHWAELNDTGKATWRKIVTAALPHLARAQSQSDEATRFGVERQLNDLLRFQNALIEASEMPDDTEPEQVLPWFIERLKMADVGDYESAIGPAREAAIRAEERELCAKLVKTMGLGSNGEIVAAAIRARSTGG